MDRAEFLNRLEAQLLDVPQAEREEALQYYEDYLNDAGDAGDFDILQELGTPEKVADSIRNGLRQESSDAGERSGQADENWQGSSRTVSWVTAVISPKTATSTGSRRRKSCSG